MLLISRYPTGVTNDERAVRQSCLVENGIKRLTMMEIRVLKVRGELNLDELKEVIATGHTATRQGQDGWQMPASSEVGDLAVWYSGVPQQEFIANGWVCGLPYKPK
jgi:hypothetical protein